MSTSGRLALLTTALLLMAVGIACTRTSDTSDVKRTAAFGQWTGGVETVPSPATGTSTAPQLTGNSAGAILSWLETANLRATLKFSTRTPAGWSEPRVVAAGG